MSTTVTSSAAAPPGDAQRQATVLPVPMVKDTMTFDGRQASRLRDMERRAEVEMRRKKREWEREVEKMKDEFLRLYPDDRVWGSEEMLNDPLVSKRCGSTDILDEKKMKTLFLEYPDIGRRYRLRFDVTDYDAKSVRVSTDGDRIVVRATKTEDGTTKQFSRKIQKPRDVDHTKFKSYLTADSILIVEAPLPASSSGTHCVRKAIISSPSHSTSRSISPSGSPAGAAPDTPSKEKIGVPIFRDENGQRRLHLVVDMGTTFLPQDITVQVIKDNKIQVYAKHEEKTTERLSKSKFSKEYELSEKIETLSLTGGLAADGRLIVGAYAKGHGEGFGIKTVPAPPDAGENQAVDGGATPVEQNGVPPDDPPTAPPDGH